MASGTQKRKLIALDPELKSPLAEHFEAGLRARVIGQRRAVDSITSLYQVFRADLTSHNRPIGAMLFLGPTGSGKTRSVEAAAEVLFGDPNAIIKIDCAELQHSHEIAKLVGSPPGYLGHRETPPVLTQENLDRFHTDRDPFTLVLFDEIEKASDALWQLLLGILDKATLTLGDNRRVNFSQTMIFMTSNLGANEMSQLITGSIGFAPSRGKGMVEQDLDQKIYRTALEAARRKFSPEFMNRIDKVVVFRTLKENQLRQVLELELGAVKRRLYQEHLGHFRLTDEAKQYLLAEGTDYQYGARHLKRSIERLLVIPLANLVATEQLRTGDLVVVDFDGQSRKLTFFRDGEVASVAQAAMEAAQAMLANRERSRIAA